MNIKDEMQLQTGDILLFRGTSWISRLVEWMGRSSYSHVGIIIKNPRFLNPELEDGLYLLESSWNAIPDVEDNQYKVGVQLHHLDDIINECSKGELYVRQVQAERTPSFYETLSRVHKEIHNKPYDMNPWDWLCAKYNMMCPFPPDTRFQSTKQFWCSALVSYLFCEVGWMEKDINWSLIAPKEFTSTGCIRFLCPLTPERKLY